MVKQSTMVNCVSSLLLAGCLVVGLAGCGGGLTKFPTATTTGKVVCKGKPVEFALVFFEPLKKGESANAGKQGVGITDSEGNFSITTYRDDDGAVVGMHRVRVGAPERPGWSCDCETNSEKDLMQVEIKDGEDNFFELVLPDKPKRKRRGGVGGLDEDPDEDED